MTGLPMRAWKRIAPLCYEHVSGDCRVFRDGVDNWRYKARTSAQSTGPYGTKQDAMSAATAALGLLAGPPDPKYRMNDAYEGFLLAALAFVEAQVMIDHGIPAQDKRNAQYKRMTEELSRLAAENDGELPKITAD